LPLLKFRPSYITELPICRSARYNGQTKTQHFGDIKVVPECHKDNLLRGADKRLGLQLCECPTVQQGHT